MPGEAVAATGNREPIDPKFLRRVTPARPRVSAVAAGIPKSLFSPAENPEKEGRQRD